MQSIHEHADALPTIYSRKFPTGLCLSNQVVTTNCDFVNFMYMINCFDRK